MRGTSEMSADKRGAYVIIFNISTQIIVVIKFGHCAKIAVVIKAFSVKRLEYNERGATAGD